MNRARWLAAAVVAFASFLLLGVDVGRAGEPAALLAWERGLVGPGATVAWWLTWTCYVYLLVPAGLALLVVAWRVPAWRARIWFSLAMALLCWQGADLFQRFFARPRRLDWIVHHETAYSYPSSHAAIVTGFYLLWALMLASPELPAPVRRTAPALLVLLAVGVLWSRLALGAHYLTDLAGGCLLAVALVCAALAAVPIKLLAPPAGRP